MNALVYRSNMSDLDLAGTVSMQGKLSQASLAFLWDHCVAGRALFPAAAMLEAASAAAGSGLGSQAETSSAALSSVTIPAAFQLPQLGVLPPAVSVTLEPASGLLGFHSQGGNKAWTIHLRCSVAIVTEVGPAPSSGQNVRGRSHGVLSPLLSPEKLSKPVTAPAACGSVSQRKALQSQEYIFDPAVIDNGTQVVLLDYTGLCR